MYLIRQFVIVRVTNFYKKRVLVARVSLETRAVTNTQAQYVLHWRSHRDDLTHGTT